MGRERWDLPEKNGCLLCCLALCPCGVWFLVLISHRTVWFVILGRLISHSGTVRTPQPSPPPPPPPPPSTQVLHRQRRHDRPGGSVSVHARGRHPAGGDHLHTAISHGRRRRGVAAAVDHQWLRHIFFRSERGGRTIQLAVCCCLIVVMIGCVFPLLRTLISRNATTADRRGRWLVGDPGHGALNGGARRSQNRDDLFLCVRRRRRASFLLQLVCCCWLHELFLFPFLIDDDTHFSFPPEANWTTMIRSSLIGCVRLLDYYTRPSLAAWVLSEWGWGSGYMISSGRCWEEIYHLWVTEDFLCGCVVPKRDIRVFSVFPPLSHRRSAKW